MRISISDEVRERCPKVSLGVLRYRVTVEKSCGLWLEVFDGKIKELEEKIVVGDIGSMPHIQSTRAAYKLLGRTPISTAMQRRLCSAGLQRERGYITLIMWWSVTIIYLWYPDIPLVHMICLAWRGTSNF